MAMIVTTGKHIVIEANDYYLERTCETPGIVSVSNRRDKQSINLPANPVDMESFIEAYRRACSEQIEYKKSGVE